MNYDVGIIGGGAAGFFCAIQIKELNPKLSVVIIEKTSKTLSKVRISGGGRCNVTHHCFEPKKLSEFYPRGGKYLKHWFKEFGPTEMIQWLAQNRVFVYDEPDGRMFPTTNDSETIAHLFEQKVRKLNIEVLLNSQVKSIQPLAPSQGYDLEIFPEPESLKVQNLVISSGGFNTEKTKKYLEKLDLEITPTVPSLFTFNIPNLDLHALSGVSVPLAHVRIAGVKQIFSGPLLITHWGLSGPAILKSSAWLANDFAERNYQFHCLISWIPYSSQNEAREIFDERMKANPQKLWKNANIFELPNRLWEFILDQAGIPSQLKIVDTKKADINRVFEYCINMPFEVSGKTTFKEEFVTAGGIDLKEVNFKTMESKILPNLFFAGEILNIDAITGGFNFQNAWTGGFIVAENIGKKLP